MQPGQVYFGLGASTAANDNAGITREGHQKVARVAHAARQNDCSGPIGRRHLVRRDDAKNETIGLNGALCRNSGSGTAATTDDCDAKLCQRFSRLCGEFISSRARLSAAEYANLRPSMWECHGVCEMWGRPLALCLSERLGAPVSRSTTEGMQLPHLDCSCASLVDDETLGCSLYNLPRSNEAARNNKTFSSLDRKRLAFR